MQDGTDRIVPMDRLDDFEIAEGDPDVRGWTVFSADGHKVGEVDDLLIDTGLMKVRYLDVEIDDDLLVDGEERHILVPIGYARLDPKDDQIFVEALNATNLREIPAYRRESLTEEAESELTGHYLRGAGAMTDPLTMDESEIRFE